MPQRTLLGAPYNHPLLKLIYAVVATLILRYYDNFRAVNHSFKIRGRKTTPIIFFTEGGCTFFVGVDLIDILNLEAACQPWVRAFSPLSKHGSNSAIAAI